MQVLITMVNSNVSQKFNYSLLDGGKSVSTFARRKLLKERQETSFSQLLPFSRTQLRILRVTMFIFMVSFTLNTYVTKYEITGDHRNSRLSNTQPLVPERVKN